MPEEQENTTSETNPKEGNGENKKGVQDELEMDNEVKAHFDEALNVPIPTKARPEWIIQLQDLEDPPFTSGFFDFFTKKRISPKLIKDLRLGTIRSPGITKSKVIEALKKQPDNPELKVFSAICTYGMLKNSTSASHIASLRKVTMEVAQAISQNALSLYNI